MTIDSDIGGTETIGQHTAVEVGAEKVRCYVAGLSSHLLERAVLTELSADAATHERCYLIELMGRDGGFHALYSAIGGGGDPATNWCCCRGALVLSLFREERKRTRREVILNCFGDVVFCLKLFNLSLCVCVFFFLTVERDMLAFSLISFDLCCFFIEAVVIGFVCVVKSEDNCLRNGYSKAFCLLVVVFLFRPILFSHVFCSGAGAAATLASRLCSACATHHRALFDSCRRL